MFLCKPVLTHFKLAHRRQRHAIQAMLILLLLLSGISLSSSANAIVLRGDTSIALEEPLEAVAPPKALFSSQSSHNDATDHWYALNLTMSKFSTEPWLIAFRTVPFQKLDVFTPTGSAGKPSYQLHKLGTDNNHPLSHTLTLNLAPGGQQTLYLRYQAVSPNRLAPELWPVSAYQQHQSNRILVISSLQILLATLLIFVFAQHYQRQNKISYLMVGHTLAASLLLLFWQGDIFRHLPWLGDPGHWVAITTFMVLIAGITSYRQLTSMTTYAPLVDKLILGSCALALAMAVYFFQSTDTLPPVILETALQTLFVSFILVILGTIHCLYNGSHPARSVLMVALGTLIPLSLAWSSGPWPRSIPSYPELIILSLQACILPVIHGYQLYLSESESMTLNVVNPHDRKRRIYESALREHLQNPDIGLNDTDITQRILSTLEKVVPDIPAIVLVHQDNEWLMIGEPSKPAEQLKNQLSSIQEDLLQIIASNQDTKINFKDRFGHFYWLFPLSQNEKQTRLLAMAPPRAQRTASAWQTACDISSHARTLLKASQQSQFWQQQAYLDALTGLLNRTAFYQEAEKIIAHTLHHLEDESCCALFIDIDDFKKINDLNGHTKGDKILEQTARLCRQALRHQDLLGRYGGEEFVALLPETESWQALHVAERIRRQIAESESLQKESRVTLSIGLATLSRKTNTLEKLLDEADKAMYLAKQQGRNQTCISPLIHDVRLPS